MMCHVNESDVDIRIIIDKIKAVITKLRSIAGKIKGNYIMKKITAYNKAHSSNQAAKAGESREAKALCEQLVRLHDQPVVIFIADFAQSITADITELQRLIFAFGFQAFITKFNPLSNIVKMISSNFRPAKFFGRAWRRKLQSDPFSGVSPLPSGFLVGDVQVASKIDSSYTSYLGSLGTTVSHSHIHAVPMNLTRRFP